MAKRNPAIIKRDSKENWKKSKYIPEENVIIIMDNPNGSISLMVGDGETNVNLLPDLLLAPSKKQVKIKNSDTLIL